MKYPGGTRSRTHLGYVQRQAERRMSTMQCPHACIDCTTCEESSAARELRRLRMLAEAAKRSEERWEHDARMRLTVETERDGYRSALCDLLAAAHDTNIAQTAIDKARAVCKNGPPMPQVSDKQAGK